MSALEARSRRLLMAYPAWYRQDRGEEMLDTLLESAGADRSWPSARDSRALILGGLRARAWKGQRSTTAASLRTALLFAAVLTLLPWTTLGLSLVAGERSMWPLPPGGWVQLGLAVLALALAAGAWFGYPRFVAVAMGLPLAVLWAAGSVGDLAFAADRVLGVVVITILIIRRERLPRSWLLLAAIVLAVFLIPRLFPAAGLYRPAYFADLAVLALTIAWSVLDARPMAAVALWLAGIFGAASIGVFVTPGPKLYLWDIWLPAIVSMTVIAAGVLLLRRQATL